MADSSSAGGGGIGLFGLLAVLFIGLKLTGHIDWGWLWVLGPLWIPLAICLAIAAVAGIVYVGVKVFAR